MATKTKTIEIDKISLAGDTQPRAEINQETVLDYAEDMMNGIVFPPVEVFYDGATYWLVDGFHRRWAAVKAKKTTLECIVHNGLLDDARWYSYARNADHGLRRTNADKRKAVMRALKHPNGACMSDRAIAEHCGVSSNMVLKYRAELNTTAHGAQSTARKCRDGRTINTANIGKTKKFILIDKSEIDFDKPAGKSSDSEVGSRAIWTHRSTGDKSRLTASMIRQYCRVSNPRAKRILKQIREYEKTIVQADESKEIDPYECNGECHDCIEENCDRRTCDFIDDDADEYDDDTADDDQADQESSRYDEIEDLAARLLDLLNSDDTTAGSRAATEIQLTMTRFRRDRPHTE